MQRYACLVHAGHIYTRVYVCNKSLPGSFIAFVVTDLTFQNAAVLVEQLITEVCS